MALHSRTGVALIAATVLVHGYQPAMIVMGALCVAAALVTAVFVSDKRAIAHRMVPRAPNAGCAKPVLARSHETARSA